MMHTRALIKRLHQLLDVVIPDTCVLCRRTVPAHQPHLLCDHCWRALARNEQACRSCALPLANGISELCGACQNHPLNTGLTVAPLLYEGTVRHLLQRFKFHNGWREGVCLASLLGTSIGNRYLDEDLPQLLLPVPPLPSVSVAPGV